MSDVKNEIIAVSASSFKHWGCINCGCDYCYGTGVSGYGANPVKCGECETFFIILSDGITKSRMGLGEPAVYPLLKEHPRKNIPAHEYVRPDIRPEDGNGEYFQSRGVGYDLAGFVKCKKAGERIVLMFRDVLNKEPRTWLDYRENEPTWIQVKIQKEDGIDLDKLHSLLEDGIITEEKIKLSIINQKGDNKVNLNEVNKLVRSVDDLTLNENPFKSLEHIISFSSKDFSLCEEDVWIYGIICGWDCKDDDDDECSELKFFKEFSERFEWDENKWKRLQLLRKNFLTAKEIFEQTKVHDYLNMFEYRKNKKIFDGTLNEDGTKKVCQICGKELDRYYFDKIDNKEKCQKCYHIDDKLNQDENKHKGYYVGEVNDCGVHDENSILIALCQNSEQAKDICLALNNREKLYRL